MTDLIGQSFGNYRLVRLLGQGGFADVYLAEHTHLNTQAAIKVLQTRLVGNSLEQFRNEGRSIASLSHPNIVRVLDFGIENGIPFLVMDYAPNGTLRQRYPKGTVLSPQHILPHLKQAAQALHYAHSRKLIHRDIKPENMLLGAHGEVLLSDFGLVLPAQSTGSQTTKEMAGTLPYIAPEQISGKPRPASDQYSLGIVVYEWLSGRRPFEGTFVEIATKHMMIPPEPLYGNVAGVTLEMQQVLFTALAKDPQQRFASVQAFATAFESTCQADGIASSPTLPTVPGSSTQIPTEIAVGDPASAPTYIKTPDFNYPPQTPVLNTPVVASNLSQSPTENVLSDPSAPTYIKTPDFNYPQQAPVLNTPSSPQQPTIVALPAQPGRPARGISATWPETPLPPIITAQPQRNKRRAGLVALLCILVVALVGSGLAYALLGRSGGGPVTGASATATSVAATATSIAASAAATVTITPASTDLKKTYTVTAVTGTPDATQHQVGARILSATTQAQSKTANATGTNPAVQATGTLTFAVNSSGSVTFSYPIHSQFSGISGVVVEIDQSVSVSEVVPGTTVTQDVPAHVVSPGSIGNIKAYDINNSVGNVTDTCTDLGLLHAFAPRVPLSGGTAEAVCNRAGFTGGRDAFTQVQQSDIDGAVNTLEAGNTPDATQALQGQIHANERMVGTPSCKANVQSDHKAGDQAASVTVTVSYTCTGEVYDQQGALAAATQWLKDDAAQSPGASYALAGKITTNLGQAQASQDTVSISIDVEGVWVYQFSDAQKAQLAQLLAGKSKSDAQAILQSQQGVKQADIQLNGTLFPGDPQKINIVVQSVAGL